MDDKKFFLNKVINLLLLIILLLSPVVISINLFNKQDLIHPLIGIQLSFGDFIIILVFILWGIEIIREKEWTSIKWPPKSVFFFIGVIILSILNASNIQTVMKEVLQNTLYFIILYTILFERISNKTFFKKVIIILILLLFICVVLAFYQCFIEQGSPFLIRGLFNNRNLLGGFFVLILPLLFAFILENSKVLLKVGAGVLTIGALTIMYSPFAVIAVLIGFLFMSLLNSKWAIGIFTIFLFTVILSILFSERQRSVWRQSLSVYEGESISANYNRVQRLLYDLPRNKWVRKSFGDNILIIRDDLFMSSVTPKSRTGGNQYSHLEGQQNIKQRYLEWQAALNMIAEKPVIGFGAGNYQMFIGNYYGILPKVNTMEPNQDNLYLFLASTLGVLGLFSFVWILAVHISSALKINKMATDDITKIIALWGAGGLLGISMYAFFTMFIIVGLMPFFIVLLACIKSKEI